MLVQQIFEAATFSKGVHFLILVLGIPFFRMHDILVESDTWIARQHVHYRGPALLAVASLQLCLLHYS